MPMPEFIAGLRCKIGHDLLMLPTVGILARDAAGRVLMVRQRRMAHWFFPGGIVEPGETPADAAVREAWEETGLKVRLQHVHGVYGGPDCHTDYPNGDRIGFVLTLFAAEVAGGVPEPDGDETTAVAFVDPATIQDRSLPPWMRPILRDPGQSSARAPARSSARPPARFQPADWLPPAT